MRQEIAHDLCCALKELFLFSFLVLTVICICGVSYDLILFSVAIFLLFILFYKIDKRSHSKKNKTDWAKEYNIPTKEEFNRMKQEAIEMAKLKQDAQRLELQNKREYESKMAKVIQQQKIDFVVNHPELVQALMQQQIVNQLSCLNENITGLRTEKIEETNAILEGQKNVEKAICAPRIYFPIHFP